MIINEDKTSLVSRGIFCTCRNRYVGYRKDMTKPSEAAPAAEIEKMIEEREQMRTRIGQMLHEALYNRIYDPDNELSDAEEKALEPVVERTEQKGVENISAKSAKLYRKYKRYEINKFRLRWCTAGINFVDVIQKERYLPPRDSDKITAYHKGYLSKVIEEAKLKRLFDPLDMRIADTVMERALEGLFPSLRGLEGEARRVELERLTHTALSPTIDTYIDDPKTQKKYEGFSLPPPPYFDKGKLAMLFDAISIVKNGLYLPPILTDKVMTLLKILRREAGKKRELDMLDASIARILVDRMQEELVRLMAYNRAEVRQEGGAIPEKQAASLQLQMLESLHDRIESIVVSP